MRALALVPVLALIAGCDPFVAEVDEPSVCATLHDQTFAASGDGYGAQLTLDLSQQDALKQPGVDTRVQLTSLTLTSKQIADFSFVQGAQVQVLPRAQAGQGVSGVVVSSSSPPQAQGGSLSIDGSGADLFPQLSAGPVKLAVQLDGSADASQFQADVTACVHVIAQTHYLQQQ